MNLPSFLRVFVDTTASETGRLALEYVKALCRIAPVRTISAGPFGQYMGAWEAYRELSMTPMTGPYVNVVCCQPDAWIRTLQVPMPGAMWDGMGEDPPEKPPPDESIEGSVELYTHGVRNVLIALELPRDATQLAAAKKYEAIVTRTIHMGYWIEHTLGAVGGPGVWNISPPVALYQHTLRDAILGVRP